MKKHPGSKSQTFLFSVEVKLPKDASWLIIICLNWKRLKVPGDMKPKAWSSWNKWFYFSRLTELESVSLVFVYPASLIQYSTEATIEKRLYQPWNILDEMRHRRIVPPSLSLIWCFSRCTEPLFKRPSPPRLWQTSSVAWSHILAFSKYKQAEYQTA